MTESTDPGPPPAPPKGLAAEAMRLFGSITQHLQSLVALAGVEGREAAAIYIKVGIALGIALFFAAFGYIFFLLFLAFAIERWLHGEWLWIALGFTAAHLLGALIAALYVKNRFGAPVFRGTAEEIRKDVAVLRSGHEPLM